MASDDRRKATATINHFDVDIKYVWEHEFHSKNRVVSLIRNWLGMEEPSKVDFLFDDVTIKEVALHDADLFISKWHYAGRLGRSGVKFGAYLQDVLTAVCVFAQPVRQESAKLQKCKFSEILELSRFCIHPSYQKKNFASWFISRAVKMLKEARPKLKKLISFSDSTFNHVGTIYVASGWRLDGIVPPDYWYLDKDGYVAHKRTVWGHASRMKKTESAYVEECGYQKVWGKEKRRFLLGLH